MSALDLGEPESGETWGSSLASAYRLNALRRLYAYTMDSWWVNSLFAYRGGILDSADPRGGIVADSKGAYAILMTSGDEIWSESPEKFIYRARDGDRGRYRLTAATIDSRHPVRIMRSHTLRCFWCPKAGVRYEGL